MAHIWIGRSYKGNSRIELCLIVWHFCIMLTLSATSLGHFSPSPWFHWPSILHRAILLLLLVLIGKLFFFHDVIEAWWCKISSRQRSETASILIDRSQRVQRVIVLAANELWPQSQLSVLTGSDTFAITFKAGFSRAAPRVWEATRCLHGWKLIFIFELKITAHCSTPIASILFTPLHGLRLSILRLIEAFTAVSKCRICWQFLRLFDLILVLLNNTFHSSLSIVLWGNLLSEMARLWMIWSSYCSLALTVSLSFHFLNWFGDHLLIKTLTTVDRRD